MTKKLINDALQLLYGHSGRDLTAEGYTERIRKLRKSDPARARRVERTLEPYLAECIFRRRKIKWHQTFEGVRVRLALLPGNPHVRQDVIAIRSALGIPDDQVKATIKDPAWKEISAFVKPDAVKRVLEGNIAGAWHVVHCQAALNKPINSESYPIISSSLIKLAESSSRVDLKSKNVTEWLRRPPAGPVPYNDKATPVDWAAGRLVERYRLPWRAALPLVFYIITENSDFLKDIEPLEVDIVSRITPSNDSETFTIAIKNVDEFVSKKEWDRVWNRMIRPRQLRIWEMRGIKPQGRRSADITRLKDALPLYCELVEGEKTIPQILANSSIGNLDQETIRRVLADLKELLTPMQ